MGQRIINIPSIANISIQSTRSNILWQGLKRRLLSFIPHWNYSDRIRKSARLRVSVRIWLIYVTAESIIVATILIFSVRVVAWRRLGLLIDVINCVSLNNWSCYGWLIALHGVWKNELRRGRDVCQLCFSMEALMKIHQINWSYYW